MKVTTSVLLTLMILLAGEDIGEKDWVLVKNKSNIEIYTRKSDKTEIKEIKAITTIKASMAILKNMLMDVKTFPQWMPNVKSTKILKKVSDKEIYYYVVVKVPWPFTNRDNILHIKLLENPKLGITSIIIESDPDYIPPAEGLVRIPKTSGKWEFTPVNNDSTNILLEYLVDPGGKVPVWVTNFFIADVPYKTILNLKEVAESDIKHN